jgi:hypothetical protein
MRIDLITLCDAAVEVGGRLHVLGTLDYFWATQVPYIHPRFALAARFRWDGHERVRKHKVRVQVVDADGQPIVAEFSRKFLPPSPSHDDIPTVRHLIIELESIRFDKFGPYAVLIDVDGKELASLQFSIVPQQAVCQPRAV